MLKQLIAVALFTLPCLAGEPVELVYKFDTDAPAHYEMVQDMTQTQTIQGQSTESSSSTTTTIKIERLKSNDDGSVLIQNTTESTRFTLSAPGTDLSYDSTNPDDQSKLSNPMIASIAGMNGMAVQLLLAPDGSILDVPNIDDLQNIVNAIQDPTIKETVKMMTSKDTIIATNEMNYKLLPNEGVQIGDEWHRDFDIPFALGTIVTSFDLTLDSIKNGVASISFSGSMSMDDILNQGVTMSLHDSSVSGTLLFNIDKGMAEGFSMTNSMVIRGSMASLPDPILTMNMSQSVNMTRIDD